MDGLELDTTRQDTDGPHHAGTKKPIDEPLPNLLKLLEEGSELPVFVNYAPKRKPGGYIYVFTFTEQL